VDTTPPQVQDLRAVPEPGGVRVTFRAVDGFSPIHRAEYSLDAGSWHYLEPVGELSDFRVEDYSFSIEFPKANGSEPAPESPLASSKTSPEHVVVVRVYDRFDNMASAKTVVRP
jgi:hypothetical protein